MSYLDVIWDLDDDPDGNVAHIEEHGLSKEDVEHVLLNPIKSGTSRSSNRPLVDGYTPNGDWIVVIFEEVDANTVYPITAYEVEE